MISDDQLAVRSLPGSASSYESSNERAWGINSGALCFKTTAWTPASFASRSIPSASSTVNKMIFVSGTLFRSSDAAAKPFITGIARSRMTRSGLRFTAFSIASRPFSASPETSKSASTAKSRRTKVRTTALSSTSKTVLLRSGWASTTDIRCQQLGIGLSSFIPIGVTELIFLNHSQALGRLVEGLPLLVAHNVLQAHEDCALCGIYALAQGLRVVFRDCGFEFALPRGIFHMLRCHRCFFRQCSAP